MEEVKFRKMVLSDLPRIMEIESLSFTVPWTKEAFINELTNNQFAHYGVAIVGDQIVGYCGMWIIIDEAHITNIAIHPNMRGKGIGKELLKQMILLADMLGATKMTLEVRTSNRIAQHLYHSLGFEKKGIRPKYYSDNQEDAIIMWVNFDEVNNERLE
ncbi:ribosomal protein S18-alanine N-acetyltransferase [Microaerobacter geothermalis]|uniref:ribosomal protein S18-alanine N-acetyltransferase n=1 Tax=Microaerobacter geothermalis TaxID=674972 RepID=UPI001F443EFF|nr:ribosomal protein S18-alanine N-acetyltransferase [Microaerobacter geothermalis]MCF6093738.1 ribosomal protein S18-alanine N-acetyltransferase [Microaerobacter geothermalis]